jgi:hypothetical protein
MYPPYAKTLCHRVHVARLQIEQFKGSGLCSCFKAASRLSPELLQVCVTSSLALSIRESHDRLGRVPHHHLCLCTLFGTQGGLHMFMHISGRSCTLYGRSLWLTPLCDGAFG